jgi:hypothetical protein
MGTIYKSGVKIKDYDEYVHINLQTKSVRFYKGRFICKNKPLHNKEFTQIVTVPKQGFKNAGVPKFEFYLNVNVRYEPTFDSIETLIIYYNEPESFAARVESRNKVAYIVKQVEPNNRKMNFLNKIKSGLLSFIKKAKDYFKVATVKSVITDILKAIWKFFHWHFAAIALGAFASWIVAEESYPFLGWVLLTAFLIMLVLNLTAKKTVVTSSSGE